MADTSSRARMLLAAVAGGAVVLVGVYLFLAKDQGKHAAADAKEPVVFRIHAPDAKAVFVTGSFNAWKTVEYRLEKDDHGVWTTTIPLRPGRYEYKFVVDTVWVYDAGNPIKVPVPLPFTGYNSVIEVKPRVGDSLSITR